MLQKGGKKKRGKLRKVVKVCGEHDEKERGSFRKKKEAVRFSD